MDDNEFGRCEDETKAMCGRAFGANYALHAATVAELQLLEQMIESPPELNEPFYNWAELISRVIGDGGEIDRSDFVRRATYGIHEFWALDELDFMLNFLDSAVKTWKELRLAS